MSTFPMFLALNSYIIVFWKLIILSLFIIYVHVYCILPDKHIMKLMTISHLLGLSGQSQKFWSVCVCMCDYVWPLCVRVCACVCIKWGLVILPKLALNSLSVSCLRGELHCACLHHSFNGICCSRRLSIYNQITYAMDWLVSRLCIQSLGTEVLLTWLMGVNLIWGKYIYMLVFWCFACICFPVHMEAGRGHWITWDWNYRQLLGTTWVPWIEPRSSGRATRALNHNSIPPALYLGLWDTWLVKSGKNIQ